MYLLCGDETDPDQGARAKFFIYGGLFIPVDAIQPLHDGVEALRARHGFLPTDPLKFGTRSRPAKVTPEQHREAKREVIQLAGDHGVQFCAQVVLHELARNRSQNDLVRHGANTILGAFNRFLCEAGNHRGLALLDRLPVQNEYTYLRDKFQIGLRFPNNMTRRLKRIVGLASTCDGASHFASVTDIVLGGFRYCVNEPERDVAGRAIFPGIARLMWHQRKNGEVFLRGRGLLVRPMNIASELHRREYDALLERLQGYVREA